MKRKKILAIIIGILIIGNVSACGNGDKNVQEEENIPTAQKAEMEESKTVSNEKENIEVLFQRSLDRTIPEGYEYDELTIHSELELPDELGMDYSKVQSLVTDMYGIVDYEGNFVVDAIYSSLTYADTIDSVPIFYVEYEGTCGYIDISGNITVPFWDEGIVVRKGMSQNGEVLLLNKETCEITVYNIKNGKICVFNMMDYSADSNDNVFISENGMISIDDNYILDLQGNIIGQEDSFDIYGSTSSNGYVCLKNSDAENEGYIVDSEGKVVSGPYKNLINEGDVFTYCVNEGATEKNMLYNVVNNEEYLLFEDDPTKDAYWMLYDLEISEKGIVYEKAYIAIDLKYEICVLDFETGESIVVFESANNRPAICGIYGDTVIFESEKTQKLVSLSGTSINEKRYYGFKDIGYGALLKNEDGTWTRIDKIGNIIGDENIFYGVDEPITYNDSMILCFRTYNERPCVVVEKNGQQVGYAL